MRQTDRQTSDVRRKSDVRQKHRLMTPPYGDGGIIIYIYTDTHADAYVTNTAREARAAANHAATNKNTKYSQLSNTHVFVPVAIETGGTWHHQAVELVIRRLEDGRPTLQAMPGSPTSCSSS